MRRAYLGTLHPHSIKYLSSGHPWVIKDQYTDQFPPNERFIIAQNRGKPFALCFHDPKHKRIKARLWSRQGQFEKQIESFTRDLSYRIHQAFDKRLKSRVNEVRENFYLIFGEGDFLPGLFIQKLGSEILIQYYSFFWERYQNLIVDEVKQNLSDKFQVTLDTDSIWIQVRSDGSFPQEGPKCLDINNSQKNITLNEFGVNYKIMLGHRYDLGIYTDMSALRPKMDGLIQNKKVLNLFCYTGAFSLYALKKEAAEVHSVDLSGKYIEWLEENLKLNPELQSHLHHSHIVTGKDFILKAKNEKQKFDFIICDPPSFSSDGNRQNNSLKFYEDHMKDLSEILEVGGKIMVFINTHSITRMKFNQNMKSLLPQSLRVINELTLSDDCPRLSDFPEGDYLKGLILEKL